MDVTDEQWALIEPEIIRPPRRPNGKGRPRQNDRPILNAILWVLRKNAPWSDLPKRYPPYQSCHRRFQEWVDNGTLEHILLALARDLHERGQLDLAECMLDGTLVLTKKDSSIWERPSEAKMRRSWQLQTALIFLSPATIALLNRMNSPLLQMLSPCRLTLLSSSA
jgi:transposase